MDIKNLYFKTRNSSLANENRTSLAEREIKTIEILEDICKIKMIQQNGNVLDLGCGDQYLKPEFNKKGMNYTGLDIEDLDLEKDKIIDSENFYDFIVSYSVIEHLYDPQNFVTEIKRVLKNGCAALIETPNWHYSYKTFYNDFTHVRPYCPESLKSLLIGNGFKKVHMFPNLRCKPKFFYTNKNSFKIASHLPFTGGAGPLIPNMLKGRALGMFIIAIKDE